MTFDEKLVEKALDRFLERYDGFEGSMSVDDLADYLGDVRTAAQETAAEITKLRAAITAYEAARSAEPVAWRLLQNGEVIEAADQVLADDTVTWIPLWGWEVGMPYNSGVFVPARRAAHPTPEAPDV